MQWYNDIDHDVVTLSSQDIADCLDSKAEAKKEGQDESPVAELLGMRQDKITRWGVLHCSWRNMKLLRKGIEFRKEI